MAGQLGSWIGKALRYALYGIGILLVLVVLYVVVALAGAMLGFWPLTDGR
jgi:hypothetical protein